MSTVQAEVMRLLGVFVQQNKYPAETIIDDKFIDKFNKWLTTTGEK